MAVRVDCLKVWPTRYACFAKGSCHMFADTLDELHAFAGKLGMKRAWFQGHALIPHYDLTPSRRKLALESGAVETTTKAELKLKRKQAADG